MAQPSARKRRREISLERETLDGRPPRGLRSYDRRTSAAEPIIAGRSSLPAMPHNELPWGPPDATWYRDGVEVPMRDAAATTEDRGPRYGWAARIVDRLIHGCVGGVMRRILDCLLLVSALMAVPSKAEGQRAALAGLHVGATARFSRAGGHRLVGSILSVRGDTVSLAGDTASLRLPLAQVDSIWIRGTAMRRGAGIGALAGGVATALIVAATCGGPDNDWCVDFAGKAFMGALGSVVGGVFGGFLGAVLGDSIPTWQLRFVAP